MSADGFRLLFFGPLLVVRLLAIPGAGVPLSNFVTFGRFGIVGGCCVTVVQVVSGTSLVEIGSGWSQPRLLLNGCCWTAANVTRVGCKCVDTQPTGGPVSCLGDRRLLCADGKSVSPVCRRLVRCICWCRRSNQKSPARRCSKVLSRQIHAAECSEIFVNLTDCSSGRVSCGNLRGFACSDAGCPRRRFVRERLVAI